MLCLVSSKSKTSNLVSSTRCIAITLIVLLASQACKGQGENSSSLEDRVTGGRPATKGRYPYMCSIRKPGSGAHVCGGIVIDRNWVMTAAHCLDPDNSDSAGMSPIVYCNIHERQGPDESKRFFPSQCYLHHLWDGDELNGNDIALCGSDSSVPANVSIPTLVNFGHESRSDAAFAVLGWGKTGPGKDLADVLQIGDRLDFVSRSTCNAISSLFGLIQDSMICVGGRFKDTCAGDSGGPLLIRNEPRSTIIPENPALDLIVGITSFGVRGCTAEAAGVYTRVSCYRPWIDCIKEGKGKGCCIYCPCDEDSSSCSKSPIFNEADALQRIRTAISSDKAETVQQILCEGLSANAVYGGNKNPLLMAAAENDAIESAKVLLQARARVDSKNSLGETALSRAARYGSPDVATLLIENEADIETKNYEGRTPLIYTARYNQPEVAEILIENGVKTENTENRSWTPLHFAAQENSIDVAKVLIKKGATIDSRERYEWTPLHLAARYNAIDVAKELIANGAAIESRERFEWTPLHVTARFDSVEVAKLLIDKKAVIEAETNQGSTPLSIAASYGSLRLVRLLRDENAKVDSPRNDGKTPFQVICTARPSDDPCKADDITALEDLLRA